MLHKIHLICGPSSIARATRIVAFLLTFIASSSVAFAQQQVDRSKVFQLKDLDKNKSLDREEFSGGSIGKHSLRSAGSTWSRISRCCVSLGIDLIRYKFIKLWSCRREAKARSEGSLSENMANAAIKHSGSE
jgi:hypothetical protein